MTARSLEPTRFNALASYALVHALLAQWIRRYDTAPDSWAHMMTFWLFDRFGVDPQTVLATPSLFLLVASGLPAFYRALLLA